MRKEDAIKILETNIYRELVRNWLKYSFLFIGPGIVVGIVVGLFIPFLPLPTITLPPSSLKIENIVPSIFTGTITATSIIVGFFAVSAYNFRQWLESSIEKKTDDFVEASNFYNRTNEKKIELEKLEKENEKIEAPEEIAKKKVEIEGTLRKCEELKELVLLNRDAYAHQQEHLGKFLFDYLFVSFALLVVELVTFLATALASWIIGIFVLWSLASLNIVFTGLGVFMNEFMTYTVHKERI
jgi:hypothetical protein